MTVKQIQLLLQFLDIEYPERRYDPGKVDGISGTKTRTAVMEFQKDFGGLTVNGTADPATEKALRHAVAYGMPEKKTESKGSFWDDIPHFAKKEFACKCGVYCNGYPAEMSEKLVRIAENVRTHFDAPVTVSSGLRCKQHNANVGGVSNSRHLSGKAMDFSVKGISAASVLDYVQKQKGIRYAYAIDSNYVHMDVE